MTYLEYISVASDIWCSVRRTLAELNICDWMILNCVSGYSEVKKIDMFVRRKGIDIVNVKCVYWLVHEYSWSDFVSHLDDQGPDVI
jgi:hypothetical protein